jgi:hypothetical protein
MKNENEDEERKNFFLKKSNKKLLIFALHGFIQAENAGALNM